MQKIYTEHAPKVIGPYSQGVLMSNHQNLIFVSGQLPMDPKSGKLVEGDIQAMTSCVIDNIESILKEAGSQLEKVIRTEIFLTDLKDFAKVNEIYAQRFTGKVLPARQTIQVAALPLAVRIEMSCIAWA